MRGWQRVAAVVLAAAAIGGGVYAWGEGAFRPCGPLDRMVQASACRIVVVLDDQHLAMLSPAPDGTLLGVVRQPGLAQEATRPQELLRIDPATGAVKSRIPMPDVPKDASWLGLAVSPSGGLVAGGFFEGPIRIIDSRTGATVSSIRRGATGLAFVADDRIMIEMGWGSFWEGSGETAVLSVADGSEVAAMPVPGALRAAGVSSAVSPDGTLAAEHVKTRGDSGVIAIRLADNARRSLSGQLLVGALATWRGNSSHLIPLLAFSPDGRSLAASFDDPGVWGRETAALFIWDVADGRLLRRVPTRSQWRDLVWSADSRSLMVTRYTPDTYTGPVKTGVSELARIDLDD
jgi:WD40 repeat protein